MTGEQGNNKSPKKQKNNRIGGIAAFSLLIALFDRFGDIVYNALINGFIGKIFTSYTALRNHVSNGFFATYVLRNSKIKRFFRRIRGFFARNLESSISLLLANKIIDKFCSLPLQYFGNFGLFFGIYSLVIYFIRLFVPWLDAASTSHLWTAIFITVASVPLLFSRINLATSIKNSVFGRGLFKHTFGIPDVSFDNKKNTTRAKGNLMLILGLLTGISTLFVHPLYIVIALASVVFITLIAVTPEIGVLLTIVAVPFLTFTQNPTIWLAILVGITAFFYFIKIIRGKRMLKLEILDIVILLFGIMIMLSSIYSAGGNASVASAGMTLILLLGYFLFVNLMRTEQWIKRAIIGFVSSASIVALIGVFEFIFGNKSTNWLDSSFHDVIKTRVVSLFENPNMLAVFLVMAFPFLLALCIKAKERNEKFLTRALVALFTLCIIFTWSRAAWIAVIIGVLLFSAIYTKKSFRIFGVILIGIPLLPIILPTSILERFLSISNFADSSIAYRIYTWLGTLNAIKDYLLFGIGYGDSAFQTVYPVYSYAGIEAAPHSHSLILQLLLCMGLVGFLVFCAAIFFSLQKSFEYIKNEKNLNSAVYVIASVASIASALFIGIFDYIWYNPRIFYLFWIVIAIGCAFVRVGDYERLRHEDFKHD